MPFEELVHRNVGSRLEGVQVSYAKSLRISIGADVIDKLKWKAKEKVQVLLGTAEDDGKIRLIKAERGRALIGQKNSAILCLQVKLPAPPPGKAGTARRGLQLRQRRHRDPASSLVLAARRRGLADATAGDAGPRWRTDRAAEPRSADGTAVTELCPTCGGEMLLRKRSDCQTMRPFCRSCERKRLAAWRANNRGRFRQTKAAWQQANPLKRAAHKAVEHAVASGNLEPRPCERCGDAIGVQAHHDDYSKPLEVMWLCPRHHGERHKELRALRRGEEAA